MLPETIYARFSSQVEVAQLSTAVYNGVEHIIVPVVGLVGDEVIHSATADNPELVPSDVISVAPEGWNGRPCVPDHPKVNNKYVSANSPEVLESRKFGEIFNSRFEDGKLKFDAYINPTLADNIGSDATGIVSKLQNSEMVEVSTGCFITVNKESGVTLTGKEYSAVWASIVPDHLAFLTKSEGACNVEMGCGAPRINEKPNDKSKLSGNDIKTIREVGGKVMKSPGFLQRILSKLRLNEIFDDGDSDQDLRSVISKALREIEVNFDYLCHVYTDSGMIVYSLYGYNNGNYNLTWWRRSYTIDDDKNVTFGADKVQVRPVEKFELVVNESESEGDSQISNSEIDKNDKAEIKGSEEENKEVKESSVETLQVNSNEHTDCQCQKGEKNMATASKVVVLKKEDIISKLIANKAAPFDESDKEHLEKFSEKQLASLAESLDSEEVEEETEEELEEVEDSQEEPEEETEEKYLSKAPKSIRDMVNRHKQIDNDYREELIAALEETKQDVYTKVELSAMETEQLEKVSKLLKVNSNDTRTSNVPIRNFSGRGFPRVNKAEDDVYTNYPRPYDLALNSKKAAKG